MIIINDYNNNVFFINEFKDTKKIFIENLILIIISFINYIALIIVFSNIAFILLNDDYIIHSRFKISFNVFKNNIYNIKV